MLKCATSLWSADLANLAADIRRTLFGALPSRRGRWPLLADVLFFPDLVAALRPHTERPFEMHLMTTDPVAWIDPFVEAGADAIIICFDSVADPGNVLETIKAGKAGVSLLLECLVPIGSYWMC